MTRSRFHTLWPGYSTAVNIMAAGWRLSLAARRRQAVCWLMQNRMQPPNRRHKGRSFMQMRAINVGATVHNLGTGSFFSPRTSGIHA
jgi:hypothetical protein